MYIHFSIVEIGLFLTDTKRSGLTWFFVLDRINHLYFYRFDMNFEMSDIREQVQIVHSIIMHSELSWRSIIEGNSIRTRNQYTERTV